MADVHIDCPCPGTPHAEGDTVVLRDRLDSTQGLAIKYAVAQKVGELREAGQISAEGEALDEAISMLLVAVINRHYLMYGISSWTLLNGQSQKLPVTPPAIRALMEEHPAEAMQVGDVADGLYAEAVMLPLLKVAASSSQPGPTNGSTSALNGSTHKSQKRSTQSSTGSTATAVIEKTLESSDGDSNSSPSSESAGA